MCNRRDCLDQLTDLLLEHERIEGPEVRSLVERLAAGPDLAARKEAAGVALL